MSHRSAALIVVAIALGITVERAAAVSLSPCPRRKLDATAKLVDRALDCHRKASLFGLAVDPLCLQKAETKFLDSFAQADERPPCFATGDAGAIDSAVGAFVDGLVATLRPSQTASTCAARKLDASRKKASRKLKCHRKAVRDGTRVDVDCLTKEDTRFLDRFARAEERLDCLTSGDAAGVEDTVDTLVADLVAALRPLTPSRCTSSKIVAVDLKGRDKLGCHSAAANTGGAVDPACLADAEANFADDFVIAEGRGDCYTTGDAGDIETSIDVVVDAFVFLLRPDLTENECTADKLGAVARGYERWLRCHATAVSHGLPIDPACLLAVDSTLVLTFAKVEAFGGCPTTVDAAGIVNVLTATTNALVVVLGVPPALLP